MGTFLLLFNLLITVITAIVVERGIVKTFDTKDEIPLFVMAIYALCAVINAFSFTIMPYIVTFVAMSSYTFVGVCLILGGISLIGALSFFVRLVKRIKKDSATSHDWFYMAVLGEVSFVLLLSSVWAGLLKFLTDLLF
ncbi:MAG: hypothetical protein ACOCXQ_01730 [Patescibacteria group bacterium]